MSRLDQHPPAAVIGAAGFVGARLVAALEAAGVPTACFTRDRPFCVGDRPHAGLSRAGTIYFLATSVNVGLAERHPQSVADDHRVFTRFLRTVANAGRRPVVVFASSGGAVYDPAWPPPYREDSVVRPVTAYGRAKVRMERELLSSTGILRPAVVRLSNPYGPGQRIGTGQGVIAHWLDAASRNEPLRLFGNPLATRDYVYLDDCVDALVRIHTMAGRAGQRATLPHTLNIGSGEPTSLADLVDALRSVVTECELVVNLANERSFDRRDTWLDVRAARTALGWRPTTPLIVGLRHTWRHVLRTRTQPVRSHT